MNWSAFLGGLVDPYELKARIFPGLLVVLPLLVPLICVFGARNPTLTAVVGLLSGCGAIYGIASVARGRGKAVEERLVAEWGGMPTTRMLRHRDTTLEATSRALYHTLFHSKLRMALPTVAEEQADPAAADDKYKGAVRQLREATRGKSYSLLLKENIAYGFHRNMRGVRSLGWIASTIGIAIGLVMSGAITLDPFGLRPFALAQLSLGAGLTLGVAIPLWFAWFHFNDKSVKRIAYAYAERLFECLRSLPKPAQSRAKAESSGGEIPATEGSQ